MWIFLQWDSPRIGKRSRCGDSLLFAVPGVSLPVIQMLVMNPVFLYPVAKVLQLCKQAIHYSVSVTIYKSVHLLPQK